MLEMAECQENGFDGLHCPRWYHGGSCSYCGAPQPKADRDRVIKESDAAIAASAGVAPTRKPEDPYGY